MVISMGEGSDGNEGMIEVQLTKEELKDVYILMEPFIESKFGFGELSSFNTTGGGTFSIERDKVLLTTSKGTDNLGEILGANVLDYLELIGIDVPEGYSMPDSTEPVGNDVSPINSGSTDTQKGHLYRFLNGIGKCKPVAIGAGVGVGVLYLAGQILSGIGGDNNAHDAANMNNSINDIVDEVKNMMNDAGEYSFVGSAAAAAEDVQEDNADVADQGKPDLAVVDTRLEQIDGKYVITATIKNTGDEPVETYTVGIETADGKDYIGQRTKLGNLAPGETRDETINPNDCYCGKKILGELGGIGINVVVDEENLIKEFEEGNNVLRVQKPGDTATDEIPRLVNAASGNPQSEYSDNGGAEADQRGKGPDLAVVDTRLEEIDGKYVITATIENTGDEPVETYTVGIETADGKDYIGQRTKLGNLAPGETRDETINPNDCYCGKKILGELGGIGINVVVDEENLIKEFEEGNNVLRVQKPGDTATDDIPRFEDKDNIRDYQDVPGTEAYREELEKLGMTAVSEGDLEYLPNVGTFRIDIYENPKDQEENRISYVLPEGPLGHEDKELLLKHLYEKDEENSMRKYTIL